MLQLLKNEMDGVAEESYNFENQSLPQSMWFEFNFYGYLSTSLIISGFMVTFMFVLKKNKAKNFVVFMILTSCENISQKL